MLTLNEHFRQSRIQRGGGGGVSMENVSKHDLCSVDAFRVLIVHKNASDFVVTNEMGKNRLCLTPQEFQEFLSVYAHQAEELTENRISLIDLRQFPKLKSLAYIDMTIPNEHLNQLALYCPNLESLRLCCFSQEDRGFIEIGKNWDVTALAKLKNLKSLRLDDAFVQMAYATFRKIVNQTNIERLKLSVALKPDESIKHSADAPLKLVQLKELEMEASFDARKWSQNYPLFLRTFENLLSLNIKISDTITDEILLAITSACRQLQSFKIAYSTFGSIQSFSLPPKVTELRLFHCRGSLTVANIKQLLTQTELVKFSCRNTDFAGAFEDFRISPTIQSLDLDGISTNKFQLAYCGNPNLTELTWYHSLYNDEREIVKGVPLATCFNLTTLNMREGQMALETLMQLKCLRKLIMPHPMPFLNWSYLTTLLKHSSLAELTIGKPLMDDSQRMTTDIPVEGFPTKILSLQMPIDMFEVALDFWLDLFHRNVNMKLVCCNFYPHQREFLQMLINHRHFPKSLETIDVCCFTLDCNNLRKHFDETAEKLKYAAENHLGYEYMDDVYRIILCRS